MQRVRTGLFGRRDRIAIFVLQLCATVSCARAGSKRAKIPSAPPQTLEILAEDEPQEGAIQGFPPATEPIRRGVCGIPLAVSIEGMFEPGGILAVQKALIERGLLSSDAFVPGELDAATLEAIAELQRKNDLPDTGLPSYATLRILEIVPRQVMLSGDPTCEGPG